MFQRITLSDMRSFMALLHSLDDFEAAVALHILTGQQFDRAEFERAVYGTICMNCILVWCDRSQSELKSCFRLSTRYLAVNVVLQPLQANV